MADSLYAQYHNTLSANPQQPLPPAALPHTQSRKAVLARFIGVASRPPSSSGNGSSNGGLSSAAAGITSAPSLNNPRNLRYNLNSPILALSANVEGDRIVVAGREILRILRVGYNEITEETNLRLPGEAGRRFQYDVKWGTIHMPHIIATAGTTGTICLYDAKEGRLDRMLREHGRAVHRLAFNPANGQLLLSASQDGTVKLWDLRDKKSRHTFVGKAEAVRDVQFNAGNVMEFAAAFDSGAIQRWDYRKESIYERKINAHNGPAFAVDWHPDGKHCASGGRDHTVKIWDFSANSRGKPRHELTTMAAVSRIAWRPSRSGRSDTTQLATCAIKNDHRVQLWDFKRPYIPARIMDVHTNLMTGILWKDDNILWSCSRDSTLVQSHVPFAPQPIDSMTHNAISWSPDGDFTFVGQRRVVNRYSRLAGSRATFDPDDDISMREERRVHGRSGSFRSSKPNLTPVKVFDSPLDKFVPSQAAAKVSIPSLFDKEAFDYFAEHYVIDLEGVAGGKEMTLSEACEMNARLALRAQKHRTAKSWKMIRLMINSEDAEAEIAKVHRAESVASLHPGFVARRAIGLGGERSATASGGATPMVPRSPIGTFTPTPEMVAPVEELLCLPPAAFGRSPSSSTLSTDGEGSAAAERAAVGMSSSGGSGASKPIPSPRPTLTIDTGIVTGSSAPQPQRPTPVNPESKQNGTNATRISADDKYNLPLFTATTERSDPFGTSVKPTAHVDINDPSPNKPANNHPASNPFSATTTHTSQSVTAGSLQRQFSLVSEQTSSSYGILGSTRSDDISDSESPHQSQSLSLNHNPTSASLPPITEEVAASTILSPPSHAVPELRTPSAAHNSDESEKPWSSRNMTHRVLDYCTETGDVQTAATLVLLLHKRILFTPTVVEEVLDAYLTLLTRLRHFSVAALVRKVAPCETLRLAGQFNLDVDLSCGECGRAVGGRGGGWCEKCAGRGGAGCVLCGEVGKGRRWTVCGVCGHGGCEGCLRGWFLGDSEDEEGGMHGCAAVGCGCRCLPR